MVAGSFKLVIAANRDEFFHRPAKDADFWDEDKNIIGGEKYRFIFYALFIVTLHSYKRIPWSFDVTM